MRSCALWTALEAMVTSSSNPGAKHGISRDWVTFLLNATYLLSVPLNGGNLKLLGGGRSPWGNGSRGRNALRGEPSNHRGGGGSLGDGGEWGIATR